MQDAENPVPETMRPVRLVDARPGRLKHPETGPEVAILRLRSRQGTEQPLAICTSDVRKLVMQLIRILAHHESVTVETELNGIVADMDDEPSAAPPEAVGATQEPQVGAEAVEAQKPSPTVQMRFPDPAIRPVQLHVLGGYLLDDGRKDLLVRCDDLGVFVRAELGRGDLITFTKQVNEAQAYSYLIRTNTKVMPTDLRILSPEQIERMVEGKTWTYSPHQVITKPRKKRGQPAGSRPRKRP